MSVRYAGRQVLADVSLDIPAGEIMALVGPSGCGKTTFLKALNRLTDLVPQCEVAGQITICDREICCPGVDVVSLRRQVGMIFQRPNPFPLSIYTNFELPLRERGCTKFEIEESMQVALGDVGLWDEVKDRLQQPACCLSGGQQQRLCIARAIALKPDVILLDEPCSSLDPLSSAKVEELILRLRERYTVVVVTHNLAQARRIADQVALFWVCDEVGRLVEVGSTEQMFGAPRSELTAAYVNGIAG
ncbi:MAG: phosphate ABC transporter ATP-binding protein [Myxococcota bacterium]